jgi:hypothetical protein
MRCKSEIEALQTNDYHQLQLPSIQIVKEAKSYAKIEDSVRIVEIEATFIC